MGLLCLLVASCLGGGPDKPGTAGVHRADRIGLLLSNLHNPFFVELEQGARAAAQRVGAQVVVRDARDDVGVQSAQVDELVKTRLDLLVINPVGPAVADAVQRAVAGGLPVITVDRSLRGVSAVSFIASDNVAGGHTAAAYLADSLGHAGDVIEVTGGDVTSADRERGAGFRQALVSYPAIHVVDRFAAGFDRGTARRLFAQALARHPQVKGVFAHNDEMVLGVLDALRAAHRTKQVALIGFDGIAEVVDEIDRGLIDATIAQQPAEMGRISIETAVAYLGGGRVDGVITVDVALVTP